MMYLFRRLKHSSDLTSGYLLVSVLGESACQVAMSKVLPTFAALRDGSMQSSVLGRRARLGSSFLSEHSLVVSSIPRGHGSGFRRHTLALWPSCQGKAARCCLEKVSEHWTKQCQFTKFCQPLPGPSSSQFRGLLEFPWELVSWSFKQLQPFRP